MSEQLHRVQRSRRRRKALILFLVLLGMAAVAVMLFGQRKLIIAKMRSFVSEEPPTSGPTADSDRSRIYRAKVPNAPTEPAQSPPTAIRRTKTQTKKAAAGGREKKFQSGSRRSSRTASPSPTTGGSRKPIPSRSSKARKPIRQDVPRPGPAPARAPARPPVRQTTVSKDGRSTETATSAKRPAKTRPRRTYDRMADSKLKLQALAWSEDAARRMAVINGRIVHEGESVDGYQVEQIRPEDVIVNAGGKSWRLEFGLRQ